MKLTLSVLALVAGVLAAPVAQGSYDDYGMLLPQLHDVKHRPPIRIPGFSPILRTSTAFRQYTDFLQATIKMFPPLP